MAEISKEHLSSRSKSKTATAKLLHLRFQKLECPFTESADETWITDLIFKPGEPRIRILQWLLSRFHSTAYNFLDPIYSRSEARLKAILQVASSLGLCRPTDLELIEGKGSMRKQMVFMDKLLSIVEIADNSQQSSPFSPSKYTIRWISGSMKDASRSRCSDSTSINDQYSRDCSLVDSIVQQQPIEQLFPPSISVLPIDVQRCLERTALSSTSDRDNRDMLSIRELSERATLLEQDLTRQCELLKQLKSEHNLMPVDRNARETQIRKFRLILSELQQMMVNFGYCYENHIQPWCNREAPVLSKLGDKIASVQRMLNNFTTVLGAMKVMKLSHDRLDTLCTELDGHLDSSTHPAADSDSKERELTKLYSTLDKLEQSLSVSTLAFT